MRKRRYFDDFEDYPLARDPERKKLGGVCAGVARYFEVEPIVVRVIAVIALVIFSQATLLAYGLAYLILDDYTDDADSFSENQEFENQESEED